MPEHDRPDQPPPRGNVRDLPIAGQVAVYTLSAILLVVVCAVVVLAGRWALVGFLYLWRAAG